MINKLAGTYNHKVTINVAGSNSASFIVPSNVEAGNTIHLILEVKDDGTPILTRYQRVIVTVT